MFSIVAVLVCIPTNSVRAFPFLHTLSSIYCMIILKNVGPLVSSHVLATIHNATMNIGMHVSFTMSAFVFSGYMSRSRIAGPYGNSIFSF